MLIFNFCAVLNRPSRFSFITCLNSRAVYACPCWFFSLVLYTHTSRNLLTALALTHWFILQESVPQSMQLIVIVINDLTLWIVWNIIYVINGSVKNLILHMSTAYFVINSRFKFGNFFKLDTCALTRNCYHKYMALSLTYIIISYTCECTICKFPYSYSVHKDTTSASGLTYLK